MKSIYSLSNMKEFIISSIFGDQIPKESSIEQIDKCYLRILYKLYVFCLSVLDVDYIDDIKFLSCIKNSSEIFSNLSFGFIDTRSIYYLENYMEYFCCLNKVIMINILYRNVSCVDFNFVFKLKVRDKKDVFVNPPKELNSLNVIDSLIIKRKIGSYYYKNSFYNFLCKNYDCLTKYLTSYIIKEQFQFI